MMDLPSAGLPDEPVDHQTQVESKMSDSSLARRVTDDEGKSMKDFSEMLDRQDLTTNIADVKEARPSGLAETERQSHLPDTDVSQSDPRDNEYEDEMAEEFSKPWVSKGKDVLLRGKKIRLERTPRNFKHPLSQLAQVRHVDDEEEKGEPASRSISDDTVSPLSPAADKQAELLPVSPVKPKQPSKFPAINWDEEYEAHEEALQARPISRSATASDSFVVPTTRINSGTDDGAGESGVGVKERTVEKSKADQLEKSNADQTEKSKADQTEKSKADQMEKSKADQMELSKADQVEKERVVGDSVASDMVSGVAEADNTGRTEAAASSEPATPDTLPDFIPVDTHPVSTMPERLPEPTIPECLLNLTPDDAPEDSNTEEWDDDLYEDDDEQGEGTLTSPPKPFPVFSPLASEYDPFADEPLDEASDAAVEAEALEKVAVVVQQVERDRALLTEMTNSEYPAFSLDEAEFDDDNELTIPSSSSSINVIQTLALDDSTHSRQEVDDDREIITALTESDYPPFSLGEAEVDGGGDGSSHFPCFNGIHKDNSDAHVNDEDVDDDIQEEDVCEDANDEDVNNDSDINNDDEDDDNNNSDNTQQPHPNPLPIPLNLTLASLTPYILDPFSSTALETFLADFNHTINSRLYDLEYIIRRLQPARFPGDVDSFNKWRKEVFVSLQNDRWRQVRANQLLQDYCGRKEEEAGQLERECEVRKERIYKLMGDRERLRGQREELEGALSLQRRLLVQGREEVEVVVAEKEKAMSSVEALERENRELRGRLGAYRARVIGASSSSLTSISSAAPKHDAPLELKTNADLDLNTSMDNNTSFDPSGTDANIEVEIAEPYALRADRMIARIERIRKLLVETSLERVRAIDAELEGIAGGGGGVVRGWVD